MRMTLIRWYNKTHWFSERDAWAVFRAAAFAEAFGWILLIIGVLYEGQKWPQYHDVLLVAGRMHGTFFSFYVLATLILSRSLGWRWFWFVLALAASVPPFGSLFFEQYIARTRYKNTRQKHQIYVRLLAKKGNRILAIQPANRVFWCLPGGRLNAQETPQAAANRYYTDLAGKPPSKIDLAVVYTYAARKQTRLEFIFTVPSCNPPTIGVAIDDSGYVDPGSTDLLPTFLGSFDYRAGMPQFIEETE